MIFHKLNWTELLQTFKSFNAKNLTAIVPLYVLTLYLRGIRWKALLLNNPKYSVLHLGEVFTVGSMLNVFLPMRAGDAYRAYYLGNVKQESKMKVFGSIILERILDGVYVFFILLAAVLLYCKQQWILQLAWGVGALFIGSLAGAFLAYKFRTRLPDFLTRFLNGFEVLECKNCFVIANIASLFIWGIECFVAYLIVNSFGLGLGFAAGLFVISLISFSTMIPSTSVFLGPYQYAYILALGIFGVDKAAALAVSTVHQAILIIILSIIGGFCLLKFNISLKEIK
jgi:uncharacterized membrane protein YbhN (UPF0104 family)